jgi:predicted ABC-type ATPase
MFLWLRSPDLAVQRVKARARSGGHDVAEDVVRRRYASGIRNFRKLYQPLADTWAVYDNSSSPEPILVAKGSGRDPEPFIYTDLWRVFLEHQD